MKVKILETQAKGLEKKLLTEEQTAIITTSFLDTMRNAFTDGGIMTGDQYDKQFGNTAQKIVDDLVLNAQKTIIETFVFENIIKGNKSSKKKIITKLKKVIKKSNKKKK